MAKVCHVCRKGPSFGHSRSHSMVATKRRFNPNLQKVRILDEGRADARLRLHPLPEGRQGHQGRLAGYLRPWPTTRNLGPLPGGRRSGTRAPRGPPPGGQRPERLPGRRRRHGRQHGADAARRARRARPPGRGAEGPHDRRDRPRRDRRRRRRAPPCSAPAATAASSSASSSAARPRSSLSRPGELVDPTLIGSAMARVGRPRLRLGPRPRRGHDPHRRARDGPPDRHRARAHAPTAPGRGRAGRGAAERARSPTCSSARSTPGQESVRRTPDLLPVLREAGVVDAGGYALTVIFAGVVAALRGSRRAGARAPPAPARDHASRARVGDLPLLHELRGDRRRTSTPRRWRERLEALGDSVLVVGDPHTLKVHVHTDDPERATGLFDGVGEVSHLDVADMHAQVAERAERLRPNGTWPGTGRRRAAASSRSSSGAGMRRLFESLGAHVVDGGPTLNPSTYELLAGDPRRARRGGRRAAELLERDHGRRARRRAVGQDRRRRADALAAGGPDRRRSRSTRRRSAAAERRGDGGGDRRAAHRRRRAGRARRRRTAASPPATPSASSRTRSSPGASPRRRCAPSSARSAAAPRSLTCISGEGAPLPDDDRRGHGARRRRARGARGRPARLLVAARRRVGVSAAFAHSAAVRRRTPS